jgi:hypothetical protein
MSSSASFRTDFLSADHDQKLARFAKSAPLVSGKDKTSPATVYPAMHNMNLLLLYFYFFKSWFYSPQAAMLPRVKLVRKYRLLSIFFA